ncbi:GNAT family N-acetyltransferase [Streptomyces sp. CA-111067]|uniref:GNAT family N-acetyltransferase n=1 Tax=Streptomyces sp. CA-111067 TaxID=3240046 RepID=UPI003D954E7E
MLPIRRATVADAAALTELRAMMHDDINGPHPREWMKACEEVTADRLGNDPDFYAYVAEDGDNGVVACVTGEIRPRFPNPESAARIFGFGIALCTRPEYRRQGLGGTLLHTLAERFIKEGCERVSIFASKQGAPLYRLIGYEDLSDVALAMNRFVDHPLPVNRYTSTPVPPEL